LLSTSFSLSCHFLSSFHFRFTSISFLHLQAKRQFLEKHPLAKSKEQSELIRSPKDLPRQELAYKVVSTSSLMTTMPTVTLFNIAKSSPVPKAIEGKEHTSYVVSKTYRVSG
jgi:hypothetical protein